MRKVTQGQWLASLKEGDIGIIHGHNLFATLQNLYREKMNEGPYDASHGFYVIDPPKICESNGLFMTGPGYGDPTLLKNIGDSTECWLFRFPPALPQQIQIMSAGAQEAVAAGGHYDIMDIVNFGWRFVQKTLTGKSSKIGNGSGMFCTEFTSSLIDLAGIPYMDAQINEITPSLQLNWFMKAINSGIGWILAAHYDGNGSYFIGDQL